MSDGPTRIALLGAVLVAGAAAVPRATLADPSEWALCGPALALPARPAFLREDADVDSETIHAAGDEARLVEGGASVLSGNARADRGTRQLSADRMTYVQPAERLQLEGRVRMWDEGAYIAGERADMELETDITTVDNAEFVFLDTHSRGHARRAVLDENDVVHITDADYTTCNPDSNAWVLNVSSLTLDYNEDVGTAWHAWLKVQDVPVFYTPYATFPLSGKRKSGFLVPSIRSTSNTGFDVTVPYYFNLAPNYDATAAVRPMTKRGVQLQGEGRYLTTWGEGLLAGETLPDDREYGEARNAVHFIHEGWFAPRWRADLQFDWVSDADYFDDLGTNLAVSSLSFLDQHADIVYNGDGWSGLARAQSYQTLDTTLSPEDRPYERLPQLRAALSGYERNLTFNPTGFAEAVRFERSTGPTGTRLDFKPGLAYPLRDAAWFVAPRANVRYTQYDLDGTLANDDTQPSRLIPTFSLDSGLFFERDWSIGDSRFLQTLEPRIYYLYVPFENQDDLPVFDTSEFDFSFAQLFRENRFTGADRVGDANQVSVALTSRLLSSGSGDELLSVGVGQIFYFRDRDVVLPGEAVGTESRSPLVAQLTAALGRSWRFSGDVQWDFEQNLSQRNSVGLRFQPDPRRVVNLSYRFVRGTFEQSDVSFAWPLADDWGIVGRWNYSIDSDETLEVFGGVEYESCCWAFRTVVRQYLSGPGGEQSEGFFLQLEFKGLTGIGGSAVDFLERSVPGYENEF